MATKTSASNQTVDGLLKSMLVFARTVGHVLETRAVESATKIPLSSSKVQVLRLLGKRGAQTSTQVARFLGVSKPAVSQIIDAMVRSKHVTRQTGVMDRREVNLRLTDKGRTLLKSVQQQQRHYVRATIRNTRGAAPSKWVEMMHVLSNGLAGADEVYKKFCLQCGAHEDGTCVLDGGAACCLFLEHEQRLQAAGKPQTGRGRKKTTARKAARNGRRTRSR